MRSIPACGFLLLTLSTLAVAAEPAGSSPRVFTISRERLAATQARVRAGDDSLKPAVDRLRREADKSLGAGPFSVTYKACIPPSGDKHDYLSLAPYFWPNPATKDGMPYVRRDGEVCPDSMKDSDRRRLQDMAAAVQSLALAHYLFGHEPYAAQAAKLLRAWFFDPDTRMNPHLNYGQGIPGKCDGRGTGIIDTVTLIGVLDSAGILESSSAWTAADRQRLVGWCEAYLDWLRTSKLGRDEARAPNNHGTWYDAQVAALALYVGKNDLARETIESCKRRRIDAHIQPDGSQPHELARTKSFSYSLFNLHGLCTLASLGELVGVDLWNYRTQDGRGIRAALDFLMPYADPDKQWPHKELHFTRSSLIPFLQQAALVYPDSRYRQLRDELPTAEVAPHRARLLYPW